YVNSAVPEPRPASRRTSPSSLSSLSPPAFLEIPPLSPPESFSLPSAISTTTTTNTFTTTATTATTSTRSPLSSSPIVTSPPSTSSSSPANDDDAEEGNQPVPGSSSPARPEEMFAFDSLPWSMSEASTGTARVEVLMSFNEIFDFRYIYFFIDRRSAQFENVCC